ncbi:MAG: cytochrome c [Gemmataceae bacterium]|nr:cytochrome c [Gemmataceae bacterium]
MSAPTPDDLPTNGAPESDIPGPGGSDSVQGLHRSVMDVMNDPVVLSVDGTMHTTPDLEEPDTAAGGQDTVQALHDIFMREQAEPRDGFEPVPMWVTAIFGGLLMWGGYYIGAGTADFRRDAFDTTELRPAAVAPAGPGGPDPDPKTVAELMKIGADKYRSICVACHKPDGNGDPAQQYPPLNGSEWVAGKEASPARLARIVLYGLHQPIRVKDKEFKGQMPAQGGVMKDYEIAAAITFVRNSWGNKADPDDANPAVTPAVVKAAREKVGKRDPMTAAELLKIPLDYSDLPPAPKKDEKK